MRPIRARIRIAWAIAAGLLAGAARGQTFASPVSGSRLIPGALETVRWASPVDAEEMELVLSLDGGRTFPIRVTGDLEGNLSVYAWRVPVLPTEHARLGLRTGDGTSESETIRAVSGEFRIAAEPSGGLEPLLRVGGELRTRDALFAPEPAVPVRADLSTEPTLGHLSPSSFAALRTRRSDPGAGGGSGSRGETTRARVPVPVAAIVSPAPRLAPLPLRE